MKPILTILLLFLSVEVFSQGRNAVWCFGDSAGIDFNDPLNPVPISTSVIGRGSCTSISDTRGNLLFYASCIDQTQIWYQKPIVIHNFLNQIIQNGDSIEGDDWYQGLVITDAPNYNNVYFLFSAATTSDYGLYYSVVDMNQNSGLGAVIQKNIQLQSFGVSDGITAIKHGNGRDWWVFFRNWDSVNNEFYRYLVSPSGLSGPFIQNIGTPTIINSTKLRFSPAGNSMLMLNYIGLMEYYNFDRCSGLFNNPITISTPPSMPGTNFWGCDFSPNGRFLYVTTQYPAQFLYQYDLQNSNPANSRILLDSMPDNLIGTGYIELGPDQKVYLSNAWQCNVSPSCHPYPDSVYNSVNMNLSVINYPDSLGTACGYAPYSFYLGGKRTYYGLPNNPDYDLGPLVGSPCDTIVSVPEPQPASSNIYIYYSSQWQSAFINADKLKGRTYQLRVIDAMGREVYSESGKLSSTYFTRNLNCEGFAKGMFVVVLETDKEKLIKKFVVE